MRNVFIASAVSVACMQMLLVPGAQAEPRFAQMYKQHAGYMPGCNACHREAGGSELNPYGQAFKKAGAHMGSFAAVADMDADADGHSNGQEIAAKANPGLASSKPGAAGDWLDTANLIPREVQKLFPGVTRYKPLDALLTEADIARAAKLGVQLGPEDETTIYIPIGERKPVGTAIIVPAHYQDMNFFLILATDRQLKVTQASPMHAARWPQVAESAALSQVVGLDVSALPAGGGDSLDDQILAALKKAGTLLFVRLKSS